MACASATLLAPPYAEGLTWTEAPKTFVGSNDDVGWDAGSGTAGVEGVLGVFLRGGRARRGTDGTGIADGDFADWLSALPALGGDADVDDAGRYSAAMSSAL